MRKILLLMGLLVAFLPAPGRSQVVINELMADNATTLDNGGLYPDWVELYNSSAGQANIGGFRLTDTVTNTLKFIFPPNTLMPAHGYLVVWCDTAGVPPAPGFHTGFGLKKSGAIVALYAPDGVTQVDYVSFGPQVTDRSIGRVPDGPSGVWTLNQPTPALSNIGQTLAASSNLFLNEWVATNSTGPDWLELYNAATNPVSLSGLVLTTTLPTFVPVDPPLPALSFIDAVGFLELQCIGSKANSPNELDFKLSHTSGETITLYPGPGIKTGWIDQISFPGNTAVPNYWAPDVSYGRLPDGSTNIVKFTPSKTTPGASNFQSITNVLVNEALTHTDLPLEDAIELYNPTAAPVDISYWWLSNNPNNPKKFQIPAGTMIPANGYKVYYEQRGVATLPHLGFNTSGTGSDPDFTLNSAHGDSVCLCTADSSGTLTGYRRITTFGAAQHGVSFGRFLTTSGSDFTAMPQTSFGMDTPLTVQQFRTGTGLTNPYPRVGPLVIKGIMYHPPDILTFVGGVAVYVDDSLNEYVEVYNITSAPVALYDTTGFYSDTLVGVYANGLTNTWQLGGMVNFTFPTNVHLAAGESLLLVNFDPVLDPGQLNSFRTKYGIAPGLQIFGPYHGGKLKNSGGSVELYKPDPPQPPDHPDFRYVPSILVDRVNYNNKAPWPLAADGGGMALQRIVPEGYGNEPTNWVAALPTPGKQIVRLNSPQRAGNSMTFNFTRLAGSSYSIQYRSSPGPASWTKLTNFSSAPATAAQPVTALMNPSNAVFRLVTPAQP